MKEESNELKRREWARLLYTQHDKTITEIALETGAGEASIRGWISEGAWDDVRRTLLISRAAQLKRIYDMMDALHAKMQQQAYEINAKDVDLFVKYTAAVKNLEGEITIATIIEACGLFINWMRRTDLPLAQKVALHFDGYVKHKLSPMNA